MLLLSPMLAMAQTPNQIHAQAAIEQIDRADQNRVKLVEQARSDIEKWMAVAKEKEFERDAARAETEAARALPAWIVLGLGGTLTLGGIGLLIFSAALKDVGVKLLCAGVAISSLGYAAMIYYKWVALIGLAGFLAAVAILIIDIWKRHNGGVEIADGVAQGINAGEIKLTDNLRRIFKQAQGPTAAKIVKAATK